MNATLSEIRFAVLYVHFFCRPYEEIVLKVDLEELSFSGSKYHTVKSDDGTTEMIVSGKWHIESANQGVTIKIKGDGPGNLDFPETTATISDNDITLANVECSNPFVNEVDFLDPMPIAWKVSCDGGTTWCNAGKNTNQCYVTLGDPALFNQGNGFPNTVCIGAQ